MELDDIDFLNCVMYSFKKLTLGQSSKDQIHLLKNRVNLLYLLQELDNKHRVVNEKEDTKLRLRKLFVKT